MCVYIYIHTYTHIPIHVHIHIRSRTPSCGAWNPGSCQRTRIKNCYTYVYVYTYIYMYIHVYTHMYIYIYIYILFLLYIFLFIMWGMESWFLPEDPSTHMIKYVLIPHADYLYNTLTAKGLTTKDTRLSKEQEKK